MTRRAAIASVACAAVFGIGLLLGPRLGRRASGPMTQDAYLWQRAWTEPVVSAVHQQGTNFSMLVALNAEVTWERGRPAVARVPVDHEALQGCGRPVGLALRIGPYAGPFSREDATAKWLGELAASIVTEATAQGVRPAELQIDFDCAESKLEGYRLWVEGIREAVAPVPVVITALPSWLDRRAFRQVIAAADGYVLQVHSLARPPSPDARFSLCDPAAARRAVERAARLGRPFRVALPTYGYLAAFDAAGRFIGLAAEGPAMSWPANFRWREVRADPVALATLVKGWVTDRPESLRGLIWYRLPVAGEDWNWSWPTLAKVMAGERPEASLRATARQPQPGLVEVQVVNQGEDDFAGRAEVLAGWPSGRLQASDGLAGYDLVETGSNAIQFTSPGQAQRLKPGESLTVGWLRFDRETEVQVALVP